MLIARKSLKRPLCGLPLMMRLDAHRAKNP
jgi:hypothetical protein